MVGLKDQALGYEYTGAWNGASPFCFAVLSTEQARLTCTLRVAAVATIIRNEGLRGLYKGCVLPVR